MKLNDDTYEDENGRWIGRSEIDCLGTYQFLGDGFFKWECGECKKEGSSRAVTKVGGVVFKCPHCNKQNLLVRTDVRYMTSMFRLAEQRNGDNDKAIRRALNHLGQAISALGER